MACIQTTGQRAVKKVTHFCNILLAAQKVKPMKPDCVKDISLSPNTADSVVLHPLLVEVHENGLGLAAPNETIHWNIGILVERCSNQLLLHL